MTRKKLNPEIKWGISILSFYLIWALCGLIYNVVYKGTFSNPYTPYADMKKELLGPFTQNYFLGTDIYGRSIMELLSTGLLYSLSVGLLVTFICCLIGIILGFISVAGHPWLRKISETLTNLIFVFPTILLAIVLLSITGESFGALVLILSLTGWPSYAKISRGETQRIMGLSYVESAKAVGASKWRMFFKIVIPGIFPVLSIHLILGISGVIISEATLGFLGLGGSDFSWGALLSLSKTVLLEAPYIVIIFSLVLAGLIIGLNLLGDGLRDYMDPKS